MTSSLDTSHDYEPDHTLQVVVVTTGGTASILIQGEADFASVSALKGLLHDDEMSNVRRVELCAADLAFCDVPAMRELALFARRARAQGLLVSTTGASRVVRRMAQVMNVAQDLGLR